MRLEYDTVKEHLQIAENLQRKLELAGMMEPNILMREKDQELEGLRAELAALKENLQVRFVWWMDVCCRVFCVKNFYV